MKKVPWLVLGVLAVLISAGLLTYRPMTVRNLNSMSPNGIVLLSGPGTSPNGVVALQALMVREHLPFVTMDSRALNRTSAVQLGKVSLLIVPGGNFEVLGRVLAAQTAQRVREAVHGGMNYLGICAGAFIAGNSPDDGFKLTDRRFPFYADSAKGIRKEAVTLVIADGTSLKTYWEDGPELTGFGEALARYPDGTPAVVQAKVGRGWVVLTGVHLEAPDSWYEGLDASAPAAKSNAYAVKLIHAAYDGAALPNF
jgi:glutamine amidotransferase-like uncharacterized protein